jgi:hypothetical protein
MILRQFDITANRCEVIVELVRDPAGHVTDRFHATRFVQGQQRAMQIMRAAQTPRNARPLGARVGHRTADQLDPAVFPVFSTKTHIHFHALAVQQARECAIQLVPVLLRGQSQQIVPLQVHFARIVSQYAGRRVQRPPDTPTGRIQHKNRIADHPCNGTIQIRRILNDAVRKRPAMYIGDTGLCARTAPLRVRGGGQQYRRGAGRALHPASRWQPERRRFASPSTTTAAAFPVDMHATEKKPAVEVVLTTLHAGGKFDTTATRSPAACTASASPASTR